MPSLTRIARSTNEMYALFGNLNDEATAYQFYQQNGPLQMQAAQAVIVQQGWYTLKQWLLSNAYDLQVRARVCVCACGTTHSAASCNS